MFEFGFKTMDEPVEKEKEDANSRALEWFPAREIVFSTEHFDGKYDDIAAKECYVFEGIQLKLVDTEKLSHNLQPDTHSDVINARSQHSDITPAEYEGGLKVWECSFNLGKYLLDKNVALDGQLILDLGCGAGLIGILALLKGATGVHFQDYNSEVINTFTIPNIILNIVDRRSIMERCAFFTGDWASFVQLSRPTVDERYDLILTSATIYNADNHSKLHAVFTNKLKKDGAVYISGQIHYFGVGGGMRQFENLIRKNGIFQSDTVWKSERGVQREIMKITFKTNS